MLFTSSIVLERLSHAYCHALEWLGVNLRSAFSCSPDKLIHIGRRKIHKYQYRAHNLPFICPANSFQVEEGFVFTFPRAMKSH